jgi:ribulose-5-phosphate 4-epimerase/fuculose-1-phosphate aldolase
MTPEEIFQRFRAIGAAALRYDIEDSHSGNIAMKWLDEEGEARMAITAAGSQKGDLEIDHICFPGIAKTTFGHYKASSETDIHSAILSLPGVFGSIHAHTKYATVETFDDGPKPPERPLPSLRPVDPLGFYHLGREIPVRWYRVPSGSKEMVQNALGDLRDHPATFVQGHGPFVRGRSPEEAFFHLCLIENSSFILQMARRIGVDVAALQDRIGGRPDSFFPVPPRPYGDEDQHRCDFRDEPDTVSAFLKTGRRIFESRISPFHTGSISLRCVDTLLYAPKGSMPEGLPGPLLEIPIRPERGDDPELLAHKRIYQESSLQTIIHAYIPEAEVLLQDNRLGTSGDKIIPIDSEGSFLYLAIPVLSPGADEEVLLRNLVDYNTAVIRGGGVWSVGEQSLSEVLHHPSSVRDICFYRIWAIARGLNVSAMEPERSKTW